MVPVADPSEDEFQESILGLARVTGWRAYHVSNVKKRLRGPGGRGFFDLVLARARPPWRPAVFAECKVGRNKRTEDQEEWARIMLAAGHDVRLWRPENWDEIEATLTMRDWSG